MVDSFPLCAHVDCSRAQKGAHWNRHSPVRGFHL